MSICSRRIFALSGARPRARISSVAAARIDRAASAAGSRRSHPAPRRAAPERQNCSSLKIKLTDTYD